MKWRVVLLYRLPNDTPDTPDHQWRTQLDGPLTEERAKKAARAMFVDAVKTVAGKQGAVVVGFHACQREES